MAKRGRRRARDRIPTNSRCHGHVAYPRWPGRTRRNSSASSPGNEEVNDVPISLWDQIPDGPVENIFSRLSVVEVLQFRSVCKRWKNLIDSPIFSKFYDTHEESSAEPCFLVRWSCQSLRKHNQYHAYFPLVHKWKALPSSTIQPQRSGYCTRARNYSGAPSTGTSTVDLLRFDRGLCCIYPKEIGRFRPTGGRRTLSENSGLKLTVHNPVSGWSTFLPSYPDSKFKLYPQCKGVSVIVHQTGRSFQVLCAGIHDHDQMGECPRESPAGRKHCLATLLFDSVSNKWKQVADLPLTFLRFRGDDTKQVTRADCGNLSYFVVSRFQDLILLSFDRETGIWYTVPGNMPQQEKSYMYDAITLSRRRGSLILALRNAAGNVIDDYGHVLFPLVFSWDLAAYPEVQHWNEIELPALPMPNHPVDNWNLFCTFKWYAKGDFLFFTCEELWGLGAVVFNLVSKSWKVAPFYSSELPVPKGFIPQIVPFEVQLSSVLNLTAWP